MDLSLQSLAKIVRRWWWLLALAPLLAASSAYWSLSKQTPMYSASALVEINPPSINADTYSYYDANIVATYRTLITTSGVLVPFVENAKLPYTEGELRAKITTSPVTDTRFMRIAVSDSDPQVAASLANGVADQFASFAQARTAQLTGPYRQAVQQQIDETLAKITTTQQLMDDLATGQNAASQDTTVRLQTLRSNLDQFQATYRELLVTANQMDLTSAGAQTGVVVAQRAAPPGSPYSPKIKLYTLLAAFAGACLAIGAVGLFEYLDNTVKTETDITQLIGAPLLSVIALIPKLEPGPEQLFVLKRPSSSTAEAVRLLRTNIEFAAASKEIAAVTVTSAGPGEGKSTVTANLAAAMAQAGFVTVVIDADLRRPSQHKIFGVRNDRGLTTLLTHPERGWKSSAIAVMDETLFLIPSGPLPPNPADLLSSDRFRALLAQINQQADIVLVDTPPVLAVSDPLIVSTATDGVMLVARAGRTRVDALARAANSFPDSVRRIGLVLDQQEGRDRSGYYYYYGNYGQDDGTTPPTPGDSAPRGGFGGRHKPAPALEAQTVSRSDA